MKNYDALYIPDICIPHDVPFTVFVYWKKGKIYFCCIWAIYMICNKPIPQIGVLGSVKGKDVYSKKKINESICIDYRGNV